MKGAARHLSRTGTRQPDVHPRTTLTRKHGAGGCLLPFISATIARPWSTVPLRQCLLGRTARVILNPRATATAPARKPKIKCLYSTSSRSSTNTGLRERRSRSRSRSTSTRRSSTRSSTSIGHEREQVRTAGKGVRAEAGEVVSAGGGEGGVDNAPQVVLVRHGLSTFNALNIFTGWCDVPLTDCGEQEAFNAGKLLTAAGFGFDVAHVSVLKRACTSLHHLLDGSGQLYIPIKTSWRLNERHYGALQGKNKATMEEAMGKIVVEWRRSYTAKPPAMTDTHSHWPLITLDPRYQGLEIPESESLKDTAIRALGYWESEIVPDIRAGKKVIVVAHANTLRGLVKKLDDIHEDAIRNINIPTGEPFVYEFGADLKPIGEPDEYGFRGRFVGDMMMAEKEAAVGERCAF